MRSLFFSSLVRIFCNICNCIWLRTNHIEIFIHCWLFINILLMCSRLYLCDFSKKLNINAMSKTITLKVAGLLTGLFLSISTVFGQGVTTAAMNGRILDTDGNALVGATVVATHTPSGSVYGALTREGGSFNLPGLRVGGPYAVRVSYLGYGTQEQNDIYLGLGQTFQLSFRLQDASITTEEVEIIANRAEVKNGAATNISTGVINAMPTLSRRFGDFTRLTPQSAGNSFGGQDNRLNNIIIDGSSFNSSFGLAGQPGDRTGVSPISLDAIEQIQVNLSPFDVRQAGFTGAGINAVTRSGTNDVSASVYYLFRNQNFSGDSTRGSVVPKGDFSYYQTGFRVGGPIIKDKLFFFVSAEIERNESPATTFRPREAGEQPGGNVSRVLRSDLEELSAFLGSNFGYETGPYEGYNLRTLANKFLARFDYNISSKHKASVRYTYLDSDQDQLVSNSSSLGFGTRQPGNNSFSYQNSNYFINEDINSVIGELNSTFGSKIANNLIIGYTFQNEDRGDFGDDTPNATIPNFPLIEIREGGNTYISTGYEPFTPSNQLNYKTFQIQDNLTYFAGNHKITAGFNLERLSFVNVFFPGSQSVYVYNSLADFYSDANGYLANPNRQIGDTLARFQLRYSAIEGQTEPVQPSRVTYTGLYLQDEFQVNAKLNLTYGLRVDVPIFDKTGYLNANVEQMTFLDADDKEVKYSTDKLPDPQFLISPRVGFNYNATEDGSTRFRGGSGIFTGRPAFVWISNQIGNNGVLTGFIQSDNTPNYPFNPDITAYIPEQATLPASYELALTDPKFRFPQIWRTNFAVEQKLPFGFVGTLEGIFSQNVNAIKYINANLPVPTSQFNGPDDRPRYTSNRINGAVVNAVVLENTNQGAAYSFTVQLERPFANGLFFKAAYNYSSSRNLTDAGSIAAGSFNGNAIVRDGNNPNLAYSQFDRPHRVITALTYRVEYAKIGATQFSLFYEGISGGRTDGGSSGRVSYNYSNDMNGDGHNANDLIYVPATGATLNFEQFTASGRTFTVEDQEAALEAYIQQDPYLSTIRGEYAERNGLVLPWLNRVDFGLVQEVFTNLGGKRNTLQFRADILNVANLLNSDWGVSQSVINNRILNYRSVNANGEPVYRMVNAGQNLPSSTFRYNNTLNDTWQLQIGIRYIFN